MYAGDAGVDGEGVSLAGEPPDDADADEAAGTPSMGIAWDVGKSSKPFNNLILTPECPEYVCYLPVSSATYPSQASPSCANKCCP